MEQRENHAALARTRLSFPFAVLVASAAAFAQSEQDVADLATRVRDRGDAKAVVELDRAAAGTGKVAERARWEQKYILEHAPDQLEAIAAMEPGKLQGMVAARVKQLRARHPKWPIADIDRIVTWHQRRMDRVQKSIDQDREWNKKQPNRTYGWRIEASTKELQDLRRLTTRNAGLRLLGEYYEATRQTAAATSAVIRNRDLAEAAKDLPSIQVEVQSGRVDRGGHVMVESTDEYEIDVARWASGFFGMASAQSALDAKRARETADANRAVLTRLDEATLHDLKLAYAERIAAEGKARQKRIEEQRRQNSKRRR